jgi:high-affinity iron transporter
MIASLLIVFREAIEASLVITIVLAACQGVPGRGRWIAGGVLAGLIGACLVAVFAGALSNLFEGAGQEAFTGTILLCAVVMLSWHILWMSRHGRKMAAELKQIGTEVRIGQRSLLALAVVIAVAVMREGGEVVLFLFGIVVSTHTGLSSLVIGSGLGLAAACAVAWLLYRGLLIIPMRHFFTVTNGLIALLAAGMAGQAAAILHEADLLPAWGETVWDTSFLLPDDTMLGRGLHALVGYSAQPSGIQIAAWAATLVTLLVLSRAMSRPGPVVVRV